MPCGAGKTRTALAALRTRLGLGRDNLLLGNLRLDRLQPRFAKPLQHMLDQFRIEDPLDELRVGMGDRVHLHVAKRLDRRPALARPPQLSANRRGDAVVSSPEFRRALEDNHIMSSVGATLKNS